ncbi:MAG: hypothetical protein GXY86_16500 [Firmicutes bacterium]|nr:hypothetical protein [Bacillota bacterium]
MNDIRTKHLFKQIYTILITIALLFCLLTPVDRLAAQPEEPVAGEPLRAWLELKGDGPFYVGDPISVNLIVEGLPGIEYLLPELTPEQLSGLELTNKGKLRQKTEQERWKHTVSYGFVGWQAGEYKISGLTVSYHDGSGKEGTITVGDLQLKIVSVLPANLSEAELLADGLKNPKQPVGLPPRYRYIGAFLGMTGLVGLVYLLLKRLGKSYRNRVAAKEEQAVKTLEPAHLIAFDKLDQLRREQLLETGKYKIFYDRLSEIAREYLENRFRFRALEMTTEEFLMSLGRMDFLEPAQQNILAEFLQYSDLVKFAKHQPLKDEGEKALTMVHGLIEETKEEVNNDI